jgi:alpha-glucosidase
MSDNWWRGAVVYEIYPRSFADSDGDGIGDLAGAASKMDYVASLGVDAIWLAPFYRSPWADGGYDVADYRDVDPVVGTLGDFDRLVTAAHTRGIRTIVDIVPNHTSDQHQWFQQALAAAPGSPKRDRYVFRDGAGPAGAYPPSNWESRFGGPAWTRLPDGQWYLHLFAPQQPDLNWNNPEVRAEFLDILRFWSRRGADGFRVDVAAGLVKDLAEPLRDVIVAPGNTGLDDWDANPDHPFLDRPEIHEIYRSWNEVFHEFEPPRIGVAETWVPGERRSLYTRADELQQAFNFEFLRVPWEADGYRKVIEESVASARSVGTVATWMLSNHDVVRPASVLGLPRGTDVRAWLMSAGTNPPADLRLGMRRARAAILLSLALPGAAYLYQGEELGLPEVPDLPPEVLKDPTWECSQHSEKGRDGCRVPFPWSRDGVSCGFSTLPGWLPQPPCWGKWSVQAQHGDARSTLELCRRAIHLRREFSSDENIEWDAEHNTGDVVAFWRARDILVLVNTGSDAVRLPDGEVLVASVALGGHTLPGDTAAWLRMPGRQ